GPISEFKEGQWYVATFNIDPKEGNVDRRTAFIRNNGSVSQGSQQVPSFTIISNRCAHLGCPVQANGPTGAILGMPTLTEKTANGPLTLDPVVPAGFGCPCHGGQYDTEGNRTAGPPVRALDRYAFEVDNGRLILLSTFSVAKVIGTGAQAKIEKYKPVGPGEHVNGWEEILSPLTPPHHCRRRSPAGRPHARSSAGSACSRQSTSRSTGSRSAPASSAAFAISSSARSRRTRTGCRRSARRR